MNIQQIRIKFLNSFPLLGYILYKIKIKKNEKIPTLAIGFNEKTFQYELQINPKYFEKLTSKEQIAVITHEIYHVYFRHFERFRKIKNLDFQIANIAADISINQYIPNLPKDALYPETFGMPLNKTFEHYYYLLKKNKNNIPKQLLNQSFDSHTCSLNIEADVLKVYNKNLLKEAYNYHLKRLEKTKRKDEYTLPKFLLEEIEKLNVIFAKQKINIKKITKDWIEKEILSNEKKSSWLYPNRRFSYLKGKKRKRDRKIYIAIDTSASINLTAISNFLNFLYNIYNKPLDEFWVILFHHKVYYSAKINKKKRY